MLLRAVPGAILCVLLMACFLPVAHQLDVTNWALSCSSGGCPASSSTTDIGGDANRAVDGNTNGDWEGESCIHTAFENNPWWRVDLGTSRLISSVRVHNRNDCCSERLDGFQVFIGDSSNCAANSLCTSVPAAGSGATDVRCWTSGRYVCVVIPGDNKVLNFCEVEVLSQETSGCGTCGAGYYRRYVCRRHHHPDPSKRGIKLTLAIFSQGLRRNLEWLLRRLRCGQVLCGGVVDLLVLPHRQASPPHPAPAPASPSTPSSSHPDARASSPTSTPAPRMRGAPAAASTKCSRIGA